MLVESGSSKSGRRTFGDACLATRRGSSRPASASFLEPDAHGAIACQILLLPDFELNELSAVTEAFERANRALGVRRYDWRLASIDAQQVPSASGLPIAVAGSAQSGAERHLFLLSGYGTPRVKPTLLALLRRRYALGARIAAIGGACSLLSEAGLLADRPCAAHWSLADALLESGPDLRIEDRLYAIDERIATCAGRDATLDFVLRLIADSDGQAIARVVADSLNHARPREATERQLSELDFSGQRGASAIAHTVAAMRRRMTEGDDLEGIAAQSGVSQRQLQRLFRRHLGMTPTQYFLKSRLQRARHLLQYSTLSVTGIAIATGFTSISHFSRRYTELYGCTPTAERGRTPRKGRRSAAQLDRAAA